jgi:hypothetical protein
MYVLVYVDDIIVVSSSNKVTTVLVRRLEQECALKDLGKLHYFLRIEVTKDTNGILLSQSKYALEILQRAGMTKCKPVDTPLLVSEKLPIHEGDLLGPTDATNYQSIVGGLRYLTMTHPYLAFSVTKYMLVYACSYCNIPPSNPCNRVLVMV